MSYLDDRAGLAGRRGVVIGGGGGLGRACTEALALAGVHLAVADRDEEGLADTAAAVVAPGASGASGAPGQVTTAVLDARDPDALAGFFAGADERFGGELDILVNVVGGTFRQSFADSNPRGWEALIRTNVSTVLHGTHLAIPRMTAAGGGSIVSLTSIEAHRAAPGFAVYAAMKSAVTSFTRTLAVELAPQRIRVNTVAPDYAPTPGLLAITGGPTETTELQHRISIPMGRVGSMDDVAGCVLFLASDLSSFVTGTSLHPDGGALASAGWFNWPDEGFRNQPPERVVEGLLADRSRVDRRVE